MLAEDLSKERAATPRAQDSKLIVDFHSRHYQDGALVHSSHEEHDPRDMLSEGEVPTTSKANREYEKELSGLKKNLQKQVRTQRKQAAKARFVAKVQHATSFHTTSSGGSERPIFGSERSVAETEASEVPDIDESVFLDDKYYETMDTIKDFEKRYAQSHATRDTLLTQEEQKAQKKEEHRRRQQHIDEYHDAMRHKFRGISTSDMAHHDFKENRHFAEVVREGVHEYHKHCVNNDRCPTGDLAITEMTKQQREKIVYSLRALEANRR